MSPKELTAEEIQRIYQTKSFLLNNLRRKFTVYQLARHAAMNTVKFREGFYLLFHYQVGVYIKEARMQYAYFLLRHTDKPIKEVARLAGFGRTKNFMQAFKKYFGVTAGRVVRG
jgi:AraC-like DNA-binding protein